MSKPELIVVADDETLRRRLERFLDGAIRRQLLITFLDPDDRETGIIIPIDDYPLRPDAPESTEDLGEITAATLFASRFAALARELGFARAVLVWERRGGPAVREAERAWGEAFARALGEQGIPMGAQLLLHDRGLRLIEPSELLAA